MSPEPSLTINKEINRKEGAQKRAPTPPAIQLVRAITSRNPNRELYPDIIRILGPTPDGELLAACRKEWIARGYNPAGWAWLLEWYPAGGPPGRTNGKKSKLQSIADEWAEVLKPYKEEG